MDGDVARAVAAAVEAVVIVAPGGAVTALNPGAERLFGRPEQEVLGIDFVDAFLAAEHRDEFASGQLRLVDSHAGGPPDVRHRWLCRRPNGLFVGECRLVYLSELTAPAVCVFVRACTDDVTPSPPQRQVGIDNAALECLASRMARELESPIQYVDHNARFLAEAFKASLVLLGKYADAVRPEARWELAQLEEDLDLPYFIQHGPSAISATLRGTTQIADSIRSLAALGNVRVGANGGLGPRRDDPDLRPLRD